MSVIGKYSFTGFLLVVLLCISVLASGVADGFPAGDWAYNYAPEESVLLLREDGTAVLQGRECSWEDDGVYLHLFPDDGEEIALRYLVTEEKVLLYFPTEYIRAEDVPGEGLIGAWIGKESEGSNFIFRADGMFLEDGTFTGSFQTDPEAGTVLLHYIRYFDDTLCYFRLDGDDILIVDYPWPVVERQSAP